MICGSTPTTPLPTPQQRCACQYSGKYLASPKVLWPHMHCQYSGKPFVSPVFYGCISLCNLCTRTEWHIGSYACAKLPLKAAPGYSQISSPLPFSVQPPHEHLFSPPISKLPCGFAVNCGSFSLLLNYNNMQWPD